MVKLFYLLPRGRERANQTDKGKGKRVKKKEKNERNEFWVIVNVRHWMFDC